jgi:hypothetical protein
LRVIEPQLLDLRRRGAPLRVITTTYMGATERLALDRLVRDFGAEVKIQYDSLRTRLHAKAWLFRRNTGFNTAYVGSSNLSRSAMLDGVEWNVRLSAIATPPLMKKFSATFETYWNDTTYESFDPDRDRDRLDDALAEAELRLWDALSADLLCPFHYFGVADGVDLTRIQWSRGMYDQGALSGVYTGNDARAHIVLKQVHDKVADVLSMRALGFCVSIAHAEYMARVFNEAGIPSLTVTSGPGSADRAEALRRLDAREINAIFTVDVFNEGVDIPSVDTILFLRPTESATVFLQQLGRGLRRAYDKPVLTVIDFVGHQRKEFRFDTRYRAITGATRTGLQRQVEHGFPFLPAGSQIVLDRQAQEFVLANIKSQLSTTWKQIVAELRSYGDLSLADFLRESGLELSDFLKGDRSWTRLRRKSGFQTRGGGPHEAALLKRVRAVAHVDDAERAQAYRQMLADDRPTYQELSSVEQRYARMLFFSMWPNGGGFESYADGF